MTGITTNSLQVAEPYVASRTSDFSLIQTPQLKEYIQPH